MLSISSRGSAAAAADYYSHLQGDTAPEDYYAVESAGEWYGAGATALGLAGTVTREDFRSAMEGRSPEGEDLVQRAGQNHRAGWDLTFSAPKSVSVVWGTGDADARAAIQSAHDRAVRMALDHLQEHAITARRGKGGLKQERAEMVASLFSHGTSREQDPQLHSHAFVHNLARRADGSWGGIESRKLYQWKMAAGAIYRAELSAELARQGYSIQADGDSFSLAGVSQEVCTEFSTRRQQIKAALAEHGASGAKASEVAALDTRQAKQLADRDELHERWAQQAEAMDFDPAQVRGVTAEEAPGPMPAPEELLRRATEHEAVIEDRHIWQAVAVEAQHRGLGYVEIREHVQEVMRSPELMRLVHPETGETKYTTRELYQQEREIIRSAEARADETHHAVAAPAVDAALTKFEEEKGFALSTEQAAAVRHVTQEPGAVRVIVGDAGTGKSTAMLAARMAWEGNGQRVIGCALSGKAAAGLQDGSGIESHTIASLLHRIEPSVDPETGEQRPPRESLTNRDVIVVDEAGMVDSRTMHRLMSHADQAGARVVLAGDHKQLQAVGAGGVFRHLSERDSAQISEIRRQRSDWAREAVRDFARGDAAAAVSKFVDRGLVHVEDDQLAAIARAVDRWQHHAAEVGVSESLLMANSNAEVAALNEAARARMQADHRLCNEVTIQTRDRTGKPTGKLAVAEGDRLLAKKNDRQTGLKNGDLMSVERINYTPEGVQIVARLDRTGETVTINPEEYSQLKHGYAVTVHAAQGATVDRAVALAGGAMTSRESTYVQMSRMRESAEIIATRQQLRDAADQVAPTPKMIKLAERLAEKHQLALPEDYTDSFLSTRAWLNEYSHKEIETNAAQPAEADALAEAMAQSRQKETTLDYQAVEGEQVPAPETTERQSRAHVDQAEAVMVMTHE